MRTPWRYPGSGEAAVARISLGGLLLQRGAPGAALAEFDAYLAGAGGQRLAAEALSGRGQALRALGRSAEEAATWRELVRRYPNTPYRTQAERRLGELE